MLSFKHYVSDRETIDEATNSSRQRTKFRLLTSQKKRSFKARIARQTTANSKKAKSRARRMAIRLMKKRMLRGRKLHNLGPSEKASIEKRMKTKTSQINRMTTSLLATVRRIEKSRLTHGSVSRGKDRRVF